MGDDNINLLNSDKHILTSDFVELMPFCLFLSLINRPTRMTATSDTLIDNIFVNYSENKYYLEMPSALNEIIYKSYRNKINHILKKSERRNYSDLLTADKSNIKKTWQIMRNVVNTNRIKKINSKFKLPDGCVTENKSFISNSFNDFFINIGPNLAKNIPDLDIKPLKFTIFLSSRKIHWDHHNYTGLKMMHPVWCNQYIH